MPWQAYVIECSSACRQAGFEGTINVREPVADKVRVRANKSLISGVIA